MNDDTKSQEDQHARPQETPSQPKARARSRLSFAKATESRLKDAPPPNSIRYYRRRARVSLEQIANRLGVSRETIRRVEDRHTWLDAERAEKIGKALGVPKELLGFSDAPNAYAWAARAVPVIGSVIAEDEVRYFQTGRRVGGASNLPADAVALDIKQGKLRGWMLFFRGSICEPVSKDILERQRLAEMFVVHLKNGTTWWRHIKPSSGRDRFHLDSPHLSSLTDVEISWVSEVIALQAPLFDLPTLSPIAS
jgi:transcriptional regulator with XRE-family HTH domain